MPSLPRNTRGRVLVADDDPDFREILLDLLDLSGEWEVVSACDGPAALERAMAGDLDAIVIDQRMPGMTGEEVCRELRRRGRETPVVLVSACRDLEPSIHSIPRVRVLPKPFQAEVLFAAIRDSIDGK